MKIPIDAFWERQLTQWEDASRRYRELDMVKTKRLTVGNADFTVAYNPARSISTEAKMDKKSIQSRPCFLCDTNRPMVQDAVMIDDDFSLLVNPFPIFRRHFTIASHRHIAQAIRPALASFYRLPDQMEEYLFFYNGGACGASAPDHLHFQAGEKGFLPLQKTWKKHLVATQSYSSHLHLHRIDYGYPMLGIVGADSSACMQYFEQLYDLLQDPSSPQQEPMMNLMLWKERKNYILLVIPRKAHRPSCFEGEGEEKIIVSPATVDLAGVMMTVRLADFEKMDENRLSTILSEVCWSKRTFDALWKKIT